MKANTKKTKLVRGAKRANYDEAVINKILDASFLCHVGFTCDGEARIIPTAYVRINDAIYLHGNVRNQMMQALLGGQTACVTVTLLDGMVLARSAFHHSVNYRSVVLFAKAEVVEAEKKSPILDALIDHFVPERSKNIRPHLQKELDGTLVIKLTIDEASAKIRSGPPIDSESDYELNTWAGVLEFKTSIEKIEACPRLADNVALPDYIKKFSEG